jgi:transposase-like protein
MKKKNTEIQNVNLIDLFEQFGSDVKCRSYLESLRFPDGVKCLRCQSDKISRIIKRNQFMCDACKYQFSVTTGTMFKDSHLPLFKWFAAIYLMGESKKGISANQISRTLKMSYKTAWYLCHRVRQACKTDESEPMGGPVLEIDETYVGGKFSNMHNDKRELARLRPNKGKLITVGALQRKGHLRLKHIPNTQSQTLIAFVRTLIDKSTDVIYTDDGGGYDNLEAAVKKDHERVNHTAGQYVRHGVIHTNGIENVFSLVKRSIIGSYHHISEKHIDRYLDEFEHRFNNRENPYHFRDTILRMLNSENMEYKELVKS